MKESVIVKIGKHKYKLLPPNKYIIDRNTPVGDSADFYEIKPWNGRKPIQPLVFIDENGKVDYYRYKEFDHGKKEWIPKNIPASLLEFIKKIKVRVAEN